MDQLSATTPLCFWHPVGPHGAESFADILDRKQNEVRQYRFTLWSFRRARPERIRAWREQLAGQEQPLVLGCGDGRDPADRTGFTTPATKFTVDLPPSWQPLPTGMTNYPGQPNKHGVLASAFYVSSISVPESMSVARPTAWFCLESGPGSASAGCPVGVSISWSIPVPAP